MRKSVWIAAVLLLTGMCLSGCTKKQSLTADTDTVIIKEKGGFVGYVVKEFDENLYSYTDLQTLIGSEIEDYNSKMGEGGITLDSCELTDGTLRLSMTYQSANDYSAFNSEIFFFGTIREAVQEGYDLTQLRMLDASDLETVVGKTELETIPDSYIVITEDPSNIRGYAKIAYIGVNDTLVDSYEVNPSDEETMHYVIFK